MKTNKLLIIIVVMIFVVLLSFALFLNHFNSIFKDERHSVPYETEEYREKFKLIENEEDFIKNVFRSTRGLPSWAQDISADLSFSETIRLLFYVQDSETEVRILLPQVRHNAKKYHIPIGGKKKKAEYVEERLTEAFSVL